MARLDYPNFECVVVINNTPDPAFWRPIEEHCTTLGERFKFVNADDIDGFKAGALRLALAHTAADAEIIGVIDADYVVQPDWLKDLVPAFADPKVGLIQAPQDHRDGDRSVMHHVMNGEYAGFFDIGMVQRNEANAIIVHGTMCLIRRAALDTPAAGRATRSARIPISASRMLEQGWQAHYTNRRYGHGLLPDTFEAYKKQRHRWAYGGLQIVRKHWRRFLPGASRLTSRAEARVRARLAQLARRREPRRRGRDPQPDLGAGRRLRRHRDSRQGLDAADHRRLRGFARCISSRSIGCASRIPRGQMLGAVFAAMSVQWTVARAVGFGLFKDHLPFVRTAKGGAARKRLDFPAFWEAVLAAAAGRSARSSLLRDELRAGPRDQSVRARAGGAEPAVPGGGGIAVFEGSRFNDFAYLARSREAASRVRRRPAIAAGQVARAGEPRRAAQ